MIEINYRLFILQLEAIEQGLNTFGRRAMTRKIKGGIRRMSKKELDKLFDQLSLTEDALAAELLDPMKPEVK